MYSYKWSWLTVVELSISSFNSALLKAFVTKKYKHISESLHSVKNILETVMYWHLAKRDVDLRFM